MDFNTGCRWRTRLWLFQMMVLPPLLLAQLPPLPPPPNLNIENLPETSFSCEGKVVGGYYADIETDCQMFHVCTLGQKGETQDIKFLCLQGTVFDQKTRVCERSEEVVCKDASEFYDLNKELYHNSNSNKIHVDFNGNVTDSASEASITHIYLPTNAADYDDSERYPGSDYSDDFSPSGFSSSSAKRTRSEVPLFNTRRNTEHRERSTPSRAPPNQQPFSRFRFRQPKGPTEPPLATTPAPVLPRQTVTVPLIPVVKDPDRPRVVVTNGKPFLPQLHIPDPAPAAPQEEIEFPSLALPETNFTCEGKVSGGHYADPETDCRMFHICVMGPDDTITDYKFLCGNNTAFEQKSRTCQETEKIDCRNSVRHYYVNNHLIIPKTTKAPEYHFEPTKLENGDEYADYYDYYFDYTDYHDYYATSTTEKSKASDSRSRTRSSKRL